LSPNKAGDRRQGDAAATAVATRTELRVYLPIAGLQRQFAAYLAVPTRARDEIERLLAGIEGREQ
jgi:hypothetical protein